MTPLRPQKLAVGLSIGCLLLSQTRALALRWEPLLDPQTSLAPPARDETRIGVPHVIVPWPESVCLLGVADGIWPGDPFPPPDVCGDSIPVDHHDGLSLLEAAGDGVYEDDLRLHAMQRLAIEGMRVDLSPERRAALGAAFEANRVRIDEIARTTAHAGIPLLDGSTDVCIDGVPVFVDLPDVSVAALSLDSPLLNLTTPSLAGGALATVDHARFEVRTHRVTLRIAERELRDGPADGGLREQERLLGQMRMLAERAADGTLNTGDRVVLDRDFQMSRERVDDVAANVSYRGIPLLDGSREVTLLGRPPLGLPLFLELPNVDAGGLGLAGDGANVTSVSNAATMIATLDFALETVAEQRQNLRDAWNQLTR